MFARASRVRLDMSLESAAEDAREGSGAAALEREAYLAHLQQQQQKERQSWELIEIRKAPGVVWVPGITSSPLVVRRKKTASGEWAELGNPACESAVPKDDKWHTIYVNAGQAVSAGCLMWQMELRPPSGPEGCVSDQEGIVVDASGFGTAAGAEVINPEDLLPFHLYREMNRMFESLRLERDVHLRFATYDWRKFGDACWEREWFPMLQRLVEDSVRATGEAIYLGCHSMGCPVTHVFLNKVSDEWKARHIHEFLATGPAFAGATAVMQNFISGPSYNFVPLLVSTVGRSVIDSMPALYTLMPLRVGNAWAEESVMIHTPWKNYTIASLYDGSFFSDVEAEDEDGTFQAEDRKTEAADLEGQAQAWVEVRDHLDTLATERGCICQSPCQSSWAGPEVGLLEGSFLPRAAQGFLRPWCYTRGECGSRRWGLRFALNPFSALYSRSWDYCGGQSKVIDAGPGFEFFPGVTTEMSGLVWRIFGMGESYSQDTSLAVEEQKARCLADPECTGFDSQGYLKRGADARPDKAWRGLKQSAGGILQGLYMKRPEVKKCQRHCPEGGDGAVCATDGRERYEFPSECEMENARCWKPDLQLEAKTGGCAPSTVTRVHQCRCASKCEPAGVQYDANARFCWVKDTCGEQSFFGRYPHWDFCPDGSDIQGIDAGGGFQYFPKFKLRHPLVLRSVSWWSDTTHVDELKEVCNANWACAGFSATGELYRRGTGVERRDLWPADDPHEGLYVKDPAILECQRDCSSHASTVPVCLRSRRLTFPNRCLADNYACRARGGAGGDQPPRITDGPCQRFGSTGMHSLALRILKRAAALKPPGVPTTCLYIADVPTGLAYRFGDWLEAGEAESQGGGDGTVNIESMEGPCRSWAAAQEQPVVVAPLEFGGGVNHVSMLWNRAFLERLRDAVLKTGAHEEGCARVNGAYRQGSADMCRCALPGTVVRCGPGGPVVAELGERFNASVVLRQCPAEERPACGAAAQS